MASPYIVAIKSITTDGTNLFVTLSIFDGVHTFPDITPVFPADTTADQINAYVQTVADNRPALSADIGDLVNKTVQGV